MQVNHWKVKIDSQPSQETNFKELHNNKGDLGIVVPACNLRIQMAEAGGPLSVWSQAKLHSVTPRFKNNNKSILSFQRRVSVHLAINHIGNHHNLVCLSIRKFERQFGCLNVKCQNHRVLEGQNITWIQVWIHPLDTHIPPWVQLLVKHYK